MIWFLIALVLYSLGAYQAYQVFNLAEAEMQDEDTDLQLIKYYYIALWPYITVKDIYLDWKEGRDGE